MWPRKIPIPNTLVRLIVWWAKRGWWPITGWDVWKCGYVIMTRTKTYYLELYR